MYSYILSPLLPVYLGAVKATAVDIREEHGVHQGGLKSSRNIYKEGYKGTFLAPSRLRPRNYTTIDTKAFVSLPLTLINMAPVQGLKIMAPSSNGHVRRPLSD
jgi:hypothetical protein